MILLLLVKCILQLQMEIDVVENALTGVVLNSSAEISGVITDGDIRRMLENTNDINALQAKDIMGHQPKTILKDELAIKGLAMLEQKNITQLIVVDAEGKYFGMVHFHDLIREGLK